MTSTEEKPPICGDIKAGEHGETAACTRERGHTGPHDDASLGMAPWDVTVWGDK